MDFMSRVAPELRPLLSLFPPLALPEGLEAARSAPAFPIPPSEHVRNSSRIIEGGDAQEMLVKIYEPIKQDGTLLPAVLWIHGGGYIMGHPDSDDGLCQTFVEEAGCVVVSVDYRLAPEHPYPAPIEDCYAALVWMTNSAEELNIDVSRVAVAGMSAGGGLTAALALLARDRGGPAIVFQMPLYPMIDDRNVTPSSLEITDKHAIWNRGSNLAAWRMYLGEHANGEISPYAAPARAKNLSGLPPAYSCVGQLDPFRSEIIEYSARLAEAGVPVEFHIYPGGYHAFEFLNPDAEISKRVQHEYIQALARALNPQQEKTLIAAD
ncbi:acetyl esterase/lipase [Paenibacillus cellulosilyticus]|uniref:Acetyl esterase/lipase n=1 Tax=Paenibacillus cellulosilyticus TaxID=375489 RepID=A0A2V2YU16_9BACL|nr:alpha/beta hydrolase [Paenibacillus cellulosilyticus]PWV99343.1 acetyl esterase/lipase [Paenibacillus cellulosilyticus]QKS45107.1 alpha/beta hydrolase [Paenibacillus cellulosilyticus]